eukprot:5552369-Alexandrium_andersonii.AAC.1
MLRLRRGAPSSNQQRQWPTCRHRHRRAAARTASSSPTTTCVGSATLPGVPAVCTCALAFHAAASSTRTHAGTHRGSPA